MAGCAAQKAGSGEDSLSVFIASLIDEDMLVYGDPKYLPRYPIGSNAVSQNNHGDINISINVLLHISMLLLIFPGSRMSGSYPLPRLVT